MHTTSTWTLARRHANSAGDRHRGGARCAPGTPHRTTLDGILRRVGRPEPMTVAELRQAAQVLADHRASRRLDVAVAQVRVAVRLEALGA
jgi:hypothetical protein